MALNILRKKYINPYKESIRQLLNERIKICELYNLQFKNKQQRALKQNKLFVTKDQLSDTIKLIFEQNPSSNQYDEVSFTFIESSLQTFIFFATDERYVPQCKKCHYSVYIMINQRKNTKQKINSKGSIICSNIQCKKHILGDFQIKEVRQNINSLRQETSTNKNKQRKVVQNNSAKTEHKQINTISEQSKLQIKKAVAKILK